MYWGRRLGRWRAREFVLVTRLLLVVAREGARFWRGGGARALQASRWLVYRALCALIERIVSVVRYETDRIIEPMRCQVSFGLTQEVSRFSSTELYHRVGTSAAESTYGQSGTHERRCAFEWFSRGFNLTYALSPHTRGTISGSYAGSTL